jgi:hypothetical protein
MGNSWKVYLTQLTEIYEFLLECKQLFVINEPFNSKGQPSGNFRGVFELDSDQLKQMAEMLKDGKRLYNHATNDSNRRGVPINFPQILDDESIFKMQVHINKAHLSKNFEQDTAIKVASVMTMINDKNDKETAQANVKAFYEADKALDKLGYAVLIEKSIDHDLMYIDVNTLCKIYGCESVQQRIDTGKQIRANYFSYDEQGNVMKSKLHSIGVLIVPQSQGIEVVQSHERKIRTDAIYTERHPTEIIIEEIPEHLRIGRLYRR